MDISKTIAILDSRTIKAAENLKNMLANIKSISMFGMKDVEEFQPRYFVSRGHCVYMYRNELFRVRPGFEFKPEGKINRAGYAYVWFPSIDEIDESKSRTFMYYVMALIASLSSRKPKGWIFDLRSNPGGIIEYFLTPLCMLCVNDIKIEGHDRRGNKNSEISINNNFLRVEIEDTVICNVEFQFSLEHPLENVNILINRNTASAAEIVTIIMKKALGAKVYGERSYGIASLMQSTTYMGYTFYYPVSKLMFDDGADFITPDVEGVPEHLLPDGDYIDYLKK